MFPVTLNLPALSVALVGEGLGLKNRYKQLCEAEAVRLTLFSAWTDGVAVREGHAMRRHYPSPQELEEFSVVMAVGLERREAERLARDARALGRLVNVEDVTELCDFYFSSFVRRGDLLLSVNTGGKSPALAVRIKEWLQEAFPAVWGERLEEIAERRTELRRAGAGKKEVSADARALLAERRWLPFSGHKRDKAA
jgi:precorrin-2 dehydrogenase/sirohydrochlorin ferrochelatase